MPVITSPKQIEGFSTRGVSGDKMLAIRPGEIPTPAAKKYLNNWKEKILAENYPKEFASKIRSNAKWYEQSPIKETSIAFGYMIQSRMRFIDNSCGKLIAENLYILTTKIDYWLFFALLNNYYTFYQLEAVERTYGGGMLKIQVFDFDNLIFPNPDAISAPDKGKLSGLGKRLATIGDEKALFEITKVVSKYSATALDDLMEGYQFFLRRRIG